MFVCLWSPVWRTVADSLADLSPALLTVAPRVVTEERRGGLVWVDARGLDAEHIARSALEVLRGLGLSNVHVGIGRVAVVAEIRAVSRLGTGDCGCLLLAAAGSLPTAAGCSCSLLAAANTAPSAPSCSQLLAARLNYPVISHQSPVPVPKLPTMSSPERGDPGLPRDRHRTRGTPRHSPRSRAAARAGGSSDRSGGRCRGCRA
jgi:hypothetical protein